MASVQSEVQCLHTIDELVERQVAVLVPLQQPYQLLHVADTTESLRELPQFLYRSSIHRWNFRTAGAPRPSSF